MTKSLPLYLICLSGFFYAGNLSADGCQGAYFPSQAKVDSFDTSYPGCTEFTSVTIRGADIIDLTPLSAITTISSGLWIYENDLLESLDGLSGITYIDKLTIRQNERLPDLTGLSALAEAEIILIEESPKLTSLTGLEKLKTVNDYMRIWNNPVLTDLHGLESLTQAGSLYIEDNPSLPGLLGLSGLSDITTQLTIENNAKLTSLEGLDSLSSVSGNIYIRHNTLVDLSGLEKLKTVINKLSITDLSMTSFKGLSGLETVGGLSIVGNPLLSSISALENLSSISFTLRILDNPALMSLTGLEGVAVLDGLILYNNDALTSLSGLESLTTILSSNSFSIQIDENDRLVSLSGLQNLEFVGSDFTLTNNAQLNECSALIKLLDAIDDGVPGPGPGGGGIPDVGDDVFLYGNQLHCNTIERILNSLDYDEDSIANESDNCPNVYNPDQQDSNGDDQGDACPDQINQAQPSLTVATFTGNYQNRPLCYGMIEINAKTLANVQSEQYGCELYQLNPGGEHRLLADIHVGPASAHTEVDPEFGLYPPMNGWHYFEAYDGINGNQMRRTDGVTVELVGEEHLFTDGGQSLKRGILNGRLYYSVLTESDEYSLYSTDGPTVRPEPELDVDGSSFSILLGTFYDRLFYLGSDTGHGAEPWTFDGSEYDLLADIASGPADSMIDMQNYRRFNDYWLFAADASLVEDEETPAYYKTDGVMVQELPHTGPWIDSEKQLAEVKTAAAIYMVFVGEPPYYYWPYVVTSSAPAQAEVPPQPVITPTPLPGPTATPVLRVNDSSSSSYDLGNSVTGDKKSTTAVLDNVALLLNDNRLYELRETSAREIALPLPSDWTDADLEFIGSGRYFGQAYIKETNSDGDTRVWAWNFRQAGLLMADDGLVLTSADHFRHIANDIYFYAEDAVAGRTLRKIPASVIKPVPLMGAVTGSWYEPSTSGQGFVLHPIDDNRTLYSFYGFENDGTPLWLIGVGEEMLEPGKSTVVTMHLAAGGNFGAFNPDDISREAWGTVKITFNTCTKGTADFDGLSGQQFMQMVHLAGVKGMECYAQTPPKPEAAGLTGSWYDPATSGQGIFLYTLDDGRMVVSFYGFKDDSEKLWLIGLYEGVVEEGQPLLIEMTLATGGNFGDFDADDITRTVWGTLSINFNDCNFATATLNGADGQQTMQMEKLARLQGSELNCN